MIGGMPGMNLKSGQTNAIILNNPMGVPMMKSPFGMTAPGLRPAPYTPNGYKRVQSNPATFRQNPFKVEDSCKIF